MADFMSLETLTPSASSGMPGFAMTVCRCPTTNPKMPQSSPSAELSTREASVPTANRQVSVRAAGSWRKSEQPLHGTIFESFDEMSAIVSDTLRQVPIVCAIS